MRTRRFSCPQTTRIARTQIIRLITYEKVNRLFIIPLLSNVERDGRGLPRTVDALVELSRRNAGRFPFPSAFTGFILWPTGE